jgi:hypothetical protein
MPPLPAALLLPAWPPPLEVPATLLVPAVGLELPPLDVPAVEALPPLPDVLPPSPVESLPQASRVELVRPARTSQRTFPENMTITFL